MVLATTLDAPLAADADGDEVEPEAVPLAGAVAEPEAAEAVPLAVAEAAPGVGAPKVVTPDGIGPTGAEAEAAIPTKLPTPC